MQKMGVSDRRQHQTGMEATMTIAGLPEGSSPTEATGRGGLQPTTTIRVETVRECEDQANGWDAHSHEVTASREPLTRRTNWWHSPLYDGCAAALALVLSNALSSIYKKRLPSTGIKTQTQIGALDHSATEADEGWAIKLIK